jgi:hypothetical protein
MQLLIVVVALLLLLVTLWDAFVTVFSGAGGGPLTDAWTGFVWQGLLRAHHRRPIHRVLTYAGPMLLVLVILLWYLLLSVGWLLLFASESTAVVADGSGEPASFLERIFFTGTTVSGLGYGDLVPARFPWTLASTLAALSATVLLTTSLSYVLHVLSAAVERKRIAEGVFAMGESAADLIETYWGEGSRGALDNYVLQLSSDIDRLAHQHLSYHILQFFHSTSASKAPGRAVLMLSDAFFLLGQGLAPTQRPPAGLIRVVRASIENFADLAGPQYDEPDPASLAPPEHLHPRTLHRLGSQTVDEAAFQESLAAYLPRRGKLLALCHFDGWQEA